MRRVALLLLLVGAAGCMGEDEPERELVPGTRVTIGIVDGERLVYEGARVEANRINNAGGIGGALTVLLRRGTAEELLDAGIRLIVLPCRRGLVDAARLVDEQGAAAVAPCDDGVLDPAMRRIFTAGLSPGGQAQALDDYVEGEAARELAPRTPRGVRVARLLELERDGSPIVSPDALERVVPPAGVPDGTIFATYGFPDPGSRTDEFYERFKAVYGRRPESIVAARASDGLWVLASAIELAASVQPGFVSAAVREGFEVRGVLGDIEFEGGTNRPRVDAMIVRNTNGRLRSAD
jgi:Periplasmic binding protein